jgi:hypothetical protein
MSTDFSGYMLEVAKELLGAPRKESTKTEVRFGNGVTVHPQKGTWYDHQGLNGGGVISLIERETGRKGKGAVDWLRERGFHVEELPDRGPAAQARPRAGDRKANGTTPPPRADPAPARDEAKYVPVKSWDYIDEAGDLLFQVVRMEDGSVDAAGKKRKTFRQRKPDGKGGWDYKVAGTRIVPYRLSEIGEAVAQGLVVFYAEGEKAADRLVELGVPATTNPGGAGKWPAGFEEFFRGASVVVLPDNDPQAKNPDGSAKFREDGSPVFPGQDHAALVAEKLLSVASSVRVLPLPGLPPKGDAEEWIDAGGTADALYDLVDTAAIDGRTWVEERPWAREAWVSKFNAIPWRHLDDPGPEHEWLVKGWLTRRERSMVAGPSQAGKSFFVLDVAMAVARGIQFFGSRTLRGGVCYQAGEGAKGLKKRIRAYRQKHGLTLEDDLPFVLLPKSVDLYASDDQTNMLIAEIKHWASTFSVPLELVVIDTLSAATPGANENASEDMSRVLARLERVAEACQCHVMLVHHLNAAGEKPRGHTSIFANLDNVVLVTAEEGRHEPEPVEHAETGRPMRRQIRRAKVTKQKDGEGGLTLDFVLHQIVLGRDYDGDPITSCVIAEPQAGSSEPEGDAGRRDRALPPQDMIFVKAVQAALNEFGEPTPASLGLPKSVPRVVAARYVWAQYEALSMADDSTEKKVEAIRKQYQRSGERLIASEVIGRQKPWIWLTGRRKAPDAHPTLPLPEPATDPAEDPMADPNIPF